MSFSSINSISSINTASQIGGIDQTTSAKKPNATEVTKPGSDVNGFGDLVQSLFKQANTAQVTADDAIKEFVTGKTDNIQNVVLAMANADMTFQFFLEIRNKVIDSYNELMRMQF